MPLSLLTLVCALCTQLQHRVYSSRECLIHLAAAVYATFFFSNLLFNSKPFSLQCQGPGGVTVKKTSQALIIGIYDEPMTPGQCNMIVERLGDYLIDQGL